MDADQESRRAKTVVTANQKGGVGKTSTVVHLAFDFLERGLRVAVIDLDTQGNASYTLRGYRSGITASQMFEAGASITVPADAPLIALIESDAKLADLEKRDSGEAWAAFRTNLDALASTFDVVLVDTAPSLGVAMTAALAAADFVLSPIELEVYSIQGIKKMMAVIGNMRRVNEGLQFLGMMPSKVDGRNPRHQRHLDELQRAYPQLMIPATIGLRSSIADALAAGVPVWKIQKTAARKATKEVRAMAAFVFSKLEIN